MPTPESELFLAKKPKVAPTFEGVDYDDNTALKAAQDAIIREQWVKSMMARLVRDEMGKCYRREGVNHLEKCGHLRGMIAPISRRGGGRGGGSASLYSAGHGLISEQWLTGILQNATLSCSRTQRSRDTSLRNKTTSTSRSRNRQTCRARRACMNAHDGQAMRKTPRRCQLPARIQCSFFL